MGSMYGIYANTWGILMGSMLPYSIWHTYGSYGYVYIYITTIYYIISMSIYIYKYIYIYKSSYHTIDAWEEIHDNNVEKG